MTTIAFCGLGLMGAPMAERLLDAGHELIVWNRTPEKGMRLVERGAILAASPSEAGADARMAITMLADPAAVEEVLFGSHGLAASLQPGAVLVDMSTVGPEVVREAGRRLPAGVEMLDAPVRGSVPQAAAGELHILVGGRTEVFEDCREVLEVLGAPVHLGPAGSGAAMKLVANLTLGVAVSALGEALALADALGLDQASTLDVLAETAIGDMARSARTAIEASRYPARFRLELAHKDLRLVTETAADAKCALSVSEAARDRFAAALADGLADLNYSAVVDHIRGRLPG